MVLSVLVCEAKKMEMMGVGRRHMLTTCYIILYENLVVGWYQEHLVGRQQRVKYRK